MSRLLYPTTNPAAIEQLVLSRGQGSYVYDAQGRSYLEGMAGLWCASLGYANDEVIEAATRQMRELSYSHLFGGKTHPAAMQLAEQISEMVPIKDAHVFFGNSGSDANDSMMKLLRYHAIASGQPQRTKVIARERAYHGVTLASAALTGLKSNHDHFALPFEALGVLRTGSPHHYRDSEPGETEAAFVTRRADELEALILAEGPDTIAAFIAEPVVGAGGVIVPPTGYYAKIQATLDRYGIAFWDDEVICAFGRLGHDFGASAFGIRPKMMSLAKALSSAYMPISAAVIDADMHALIARQGEKVGVFGHGYTYSGHPVACAVASKVLEIYQRDRIFERAAHTGAYLQEGLRHLADHELVGEARGMGLIGALELVADKPSKQPFDGNQVGVYCQQRCQAHGLIVRALGGNSIALCPPLIINEQQIDELLEKLRRALDDTCNYVRARGLDGA